MQYQVTPKDKSLNFNMKKLQFYILKNTILRPMPENMKEHVEHAFLHGCRTEEFKFLHSNIDGYILPALMSEKDLRLCSNFKGRPGDVFVITYPKSGTLWLSAIVSSITKPKGSSEGPIMGDTGPLFEIANHDLLETAPSPRYMVTHLQPGLLPYSSENGVKYIYLARNPRDVVVSYYHFMTQTAMGPVSFNFDGTWDEFVEYFMKGNLPYGSYFDHVVEWWSRKDNENVLFLKYEELKKDLKGQAKIIGEFLGFKLSDEQAEAVKQECTFEAMKKKSNNTKFAKIFKRRSHLRKGIVGDWKNHFSDAQLEEFNQLYKSHMDGSGLEFEFEAR